MISPEAETMAEHESGPPARTGLEVAVVGMAGRFPGADDLHAFWRNLREGVESISFFTRDELVAAGADPVAVELPNFVPARGELRAADELDAALFGLTPRDAEILDPQHRVLLECAWAALEHAGHDPARVGGAVGVFAGCGHGGYLGNLVSSPEVVRSVGRMRIVLGTDKDHLAAGIAYRLDLRGPAVAVQTACSTSLVAVHMACQSLINGECDLALAGGVSIGVPLRNGYLYTPDGILSPDGHCRAFDAGARGAVSGSGAGMVVLRRLDQAEADGDTIHAVIRGSAINNDGARKVGYTAPSAAGQARVIAEALAVAAVDASSIQYLEGHGSGTPLGDAIELKAIGQAFGGAKAGHGCAIGSVKANVGHLDAAAGVAGLIKTVLALEHREIPPSLHCEAPHAEVDALGGRVFVNTALRSWERNGVPRRAGVSSFGIGGTNAHVVLEEAPPAEPSGPSRPLQLLVLSARTPTALAAAAGEVAAHLERGAEPLADAAYTLQTGRRELEHRLAVVCRDAEEGAARLREAVGAPRVSRPGRSVAFLLPGVGVHHVDMGRGLYDAEPVYRAAVDECCELLRPLLDRDLREVLYSATAAAGDGDAGGGWDLRSLLGRGARPAGSPLDETRFAQPAVFVTEYALAKLWTSWGVKPRALIGHSLGEYVAATLAGVLRLDDALRLVALRARLIDALPAGAMLAVPRGEAALREVLPPALDLAAVNTPESCVVAGSVNEIEAFEAALAADGVATRRLSTRHAFHSRAMAAVADEVERAVAAFDLRAPEIPFISNVTGGWISDEEARAPAYWARHLCRPVRFADGVATLREEPGWVLLEVGPGQALGAWAMQHPGGAPGELVVLSSLPHQHNRVPDLRFLLETLGAAWTAGVEVDWKAFAGGERRRRVPLPGYRFERTRHWVDAPRRHEAAKPAASTGDGAPPDHQKGPEAMAMETHSTAAAPAAPSARRGAILELLRGIAADLTGIAREHVDTRADLFRAGFDSLLLLQAIEVIEKRLGVRIALVKMMEELGTLDAVAGHVDAVLAPGAAVAGETPSAEMDASSPPVPDRSVSPAASAPAPPFAGTVDPVAANGTGGGSAMERIFAQQLEILARQIDALRSGGAAEPPARNGGVTAAAGPSFLATPVAQPVTAANGAAASIVAAGGTPASGAANGGKPKGVQQSPRARIQPETFVAFQPVSAEGPGTLTPQQREYLDDFTARYVARTRASKAHQARYHLPLADTRVTARFRRAWKEILYPIVSRRALGSRVWDLDGNEYIDTGMAFGCNLFGHAPDFVSQAIREQLEAGYGVGPQSPHAGRAAELICALGGNERAVFCNSGTEAVMGAVRAARALTGRSKVAMFAGSYHGWADLVQGRLLTGDGRREVLPTAPGIPQAPLADVLLLDWDQPSALEMLARHLDEIALVMVEPVQSRRLDIQPRAFLQELRRITREAGTLLLFDELITGFRAGPGGAQEYFGVRADLVTYGKIVAGGLPMGVVAGTRETMSVFDGGVWSYGDDSYPAAQRTLFAGAFFKHPLSMAVACSILEEIQRRGAPMYDALNGRTARLCARLNELFEAERFPINAVHFSSCFRFFFGPEVRFPDLFHHHLILEGIHVIPETGTHFLSTAHTDEDLDVFFHAVAAAVRAMRRGGFIPADPAGGGDGGPGGAPVTVPSSAEVAGARATGGAVPSPATAATAPPGDDDRCVDGVRVLPVTQGQRQLWLESQMGDDAGRAYIESTSIRLRGALDVAALGAAVRALVDRHDTLRTTFTAEGDAQLVHPAVEVEVPLEDLCGAPPEALEEWLRGTVRRPFDLLRGPLVRFALAAVGPDEHLLAFTVHHAALDGRSSGVVLRDLGELYAAAREGRPATLDPPPDHAALVRVHAAAASDAPAAQAYWEARFADGIPVLDLPTDRPRPAVRRYAGERVVRTTQAGLLPRLARAGRGNGLTLFNTLLSATFVWLNRLSGDDDIVVGTPSAGQASGARGSELVGFAINVLPIRARIDPSALFTEHARRVRRAVLEGLQHQGFSFPKLVETRLRARDPSRPPVFSVLMNLDRAPDAVTLGDLAAELEVNFGGGSKVDLTLDMTEAGDRLEIRCIHDAALFERETVELWLGAFERLLEEIARDPDAPLAALSLVGEAERRRVVDEWNRTGVPYPHGCIHALFEAQAARTPDAVAVVHGDERITYAELDARANRLAHHLRRRGIGVEDRVALCLERAPELMEAFFGILKAGAAYVPLDPTHPAERLRYMLHDSGARLLLTQSWLEDRLPARRPALLRLDLLRDELAGEPAGRPESGVRPENLAYVYYTSGSTGRPKGVAMHHYGPANYFAWGREAYAVDRGHGAPVFSSMAVDLTLANFIPLFSGGTVELLAEGPGVDALAEAIRRSPGYGMIKITPTHLALLNQALSPAEAAASTATLVIGADDLLGEPTRFWRVSAPGVRLLNEYGPTETVVGCSLYELPPGETPEGRVPIGRPISNLTMYVLDGAMRPVQAAIPGELYVGGVGVARGYLGRPALTADRFLPDPFAATPGARLYRTGDRARFRGDGNLEFLGRVDFQVKIRGHRIETGEVEAVLASHPGVRFALVMAREDVSGDRRLAAYVVAGEEARPTPEALRAALRERLPEYMVPSAIVFLDAFPVGTTGKVDRAALPVPGAAAPGDGHVSPRTPVEETLAGIWAEVLRVERVGVDDNFFELGGHSLLATRVVSAVRAALAVELPLRALFEAPTVAALAARVEGLRRAGAPRLPAVTPVPRSRPLPLSFAQERLWFLHRMDPASTAYNLPIALRLEGALDVAALERALGEVVRRHEVLRTTFRGGEDDPVQVIAPFDGFTLPVEDLTRLDAEGREAAARRAADDDATHPFDLAAGPLFRARLLRLAEGDHALLLAMHHAVGDGWSTGVFFRELSALYGAYREGRGSPLADPPVQYADYAVWQRERLRGDALERQLAYWRERLAGVPELLELPTDRPRPAVVTHRGAYEPAALPAGLLERLRALARREGATLYMVLLGAFQLLLSKYAGTVDVVVGSPVAGRTRGEVEGLIGCFVNTLVLRTDLSGDPTFRALLQRVREGTLGAYEHQDVPFERLVEELRVERSLSRHPLVQVTFAVQDVEGPGEALAELRIGPLQAELRVAKFDLTLSLAPGAAGLRGGVEYSTDLFDRATARRIVRHLASVLEQVVREPDARLSRMELMDDAERAAVREWSHGPVAPAPETTVHALFEARAARAPNAAALVAGGESVSYAELDRRANRLAHRLRRMGVGLEVRVAVCVERRPEMAAAILAVLKAGGAYVPLDPGYPDERLRLTLAGSSAAVLITHGRHLGALDPPAGLRVIDVDAVEDDAHPGDDANPGVAVPGDALAYVIHTSGSTGTPKGVMVSHAALASSTAARFRFYPEPVGAYLLLSPIAFDSSVAGFFWTLCSGGALVLPAADEAGDGDRLRALATRAAVTHLLAVPSLYAQLIADHEPWGGSLRTVIVAGEACAAEVVETHRRRFPGVALVNEYGPTEATVWSSAHRADAEPVDGAVPIGRPVANTRSHVLDGAFSAVPPGVPGELYVGGGQVARGYLGRPGLTAERFLPDPFAARPGERMYRTGDRARWKDAGVLEYDGRLDGQVKIRGFRVEPGEVEAALRGHPAVRACAVVAREDRPGDRRLAAYAVAEGVEPAGVRAFLRARLPDHLVPASVTLLPSLPLMPNGKLDRKALPAPEAAAAASPFDEPRNYVEAQLIPLWEALLGVEGIGATQSFFDLGGNSLLALRLFTQVNRRLGCDLPVSTLFAGATVRHMAEAIMEQKRSAWAGPAPVVPLQPHGSLPPLFFVHSADRNVLGYVNVVRHLGAGQPVYGVRDLGDMARPVARIAREHVAAIRAVQPAGPYYLASWSFGGLVAFEMALQLEAAGETVAFLGLLDTVSPVLMAAWPWDCDEEVAVVLAQDVAARMRRPFAMHPGELEGLDPDEQVRRVVDAMHAQGAAPAGYDAATLAQGVQMNRDRKASREGYDAGRFSGTLTLFRPIDVPARVEAFVAPYPEEERRTLGWSRYVDDVKVHRVPGSHATLGSEPNVRVLVRRLRESLERARQEAERSPSADGDQVAVEVAG
jgi:amino acid adenylation domain-containing protein